MPRLLNYLTAPNVLIATACSASCASPGQTHAHFFSLCSVLSVCAHFHLFFFSLSLFSFSSHFIIILFAVLYEPTEISAKDHLGRVVRWAPSVHKWTDGSPHCDLPMARLAELFNVNHFIVSQVCLFFFFSLSFFLLPVCGCDMFTFFFFFVVVSLTA